MVGNLLLIASSAILVLNVVNSVSSPTTSASKERAATNSLSRSAGWCSVRTCSSNPSFSAANRDCCMYSGVVGLESRTRIATFVNAGKNSLINSRRFAIRSLLIVVNPVTLPPGRAKLGTSPVATGSKVATNTTGIWPAASLAGLTEGVPAARIKNNVRLRAADLGCHLRYLHSALRQRVLDAEGAAFDESLFLKSFPEAPDVTGGWWPDAQKADTVRRCL